jgi:hypothetical protein
MTSRRWWREGGGASLLQTVEEVVLVQEQQPDPVVCSADASAAAIGPVRIVWYVPVCHMCVFGKITLQL